MPVTEAPVDVFDDVARHLQAARSFDRAALPLGIYLAWCANHDLLSDALRQHAEALVLRVRFREITGSELAIAGCGGVLAAEHLNAEGQAFTARHYQDYLQAFADLFGPDPYAGPDDWDRYDRIAPWLTRVLMASRGHIPAAAPEDARQRWWKFWR